MGASPHQLSKEQIISAFAALNDKLMTKEIIGEICVFGGAAMVLAFDARQSTRDVDAIFMPKGYMADAIAEVADEFALRSDWLNDGVKGFVSESGDMTDDGMPQFSHLRIMRPSSTYLLAMKCLAARVGGYDTAGDEEDALTLINQLGLNTVEEIIDVVCRYYSEQAIQPKTRYFIEELMTQRGEIHE